MHDDLLAHSVPPPKRGERLGAHLVAVAEAAGLRGDPMGLGAIARAAGALHDIGKASDAFQAYITPGSRARSPDHSTAGAREAIGLYGPKLGRLLAYVIAGHHAGLPDAETLERRLDPERTPLEDYGAWTRCITPAARDALAVPTLKPGAPPGFSVQLLTRMLFSALVDADFTETARFYAESDPAGSDPVARGGFAGIAELAARLASYLETFTPAPGATPIPVNAHRARVLAHARAKAELPPGLFTLTVPTGGGKTLTSLAFALEHARRHGLRRVVYVIPYTSIIEQTAHVFRTALGEDDVLEHHATFDWEEALKRGDAGNADAGQDDRGLARLRRAAENWDAPVVVTTAVQFFESLYANRTSRCRKLHNLARAVVVLDEAQTLPIPLLHPCLAVLDELQRNYASSVVLCTATQPAVRIEDGFQGGVAISPERELAPDPPALYAALKRVQVERRAEPTGDAEIAARFVEADRMLCIVNTRAHARKLFERIRALPGATHLTTLMCPRHRRAVLADARVRLKAEAPVRLVSTSLIEAGVDIDFPEVWRAVAGLDQIAQAAGRANREGRLAKPGRVVVFTPAEEKTPRSLAMAAGEAEGVLARHADPLTLEAVRDYFGQLYWAKGPASFDKARLDGRDYPILPAVAEGRRTFDFPFETIARAFRLIDEAMEPVIVPWRANDDDREVERLLARIAVPDKPARDDLRLLQAYVVPIPRQARRDWLAQGVLKPVHPALGEALLVFCDLAHYDPDAGLRLSDPAWRSAEDNVM